MWGVGDKQRTMAVCVPNAPGVARLSLCQRPACAPRLSAPPPRLHSPAGRIAERGTHDALLAAGGLYTELMSSQGMMLGYSV